MQELKFSETGGQNVLCPGAIEFVAAARCVNPPELLFAAPSGGPILRAAEERPKDRARGRKAPLL